MSEKKAEKNVLKEKCWDRFKDDITWQFAVVRQKVVTEMREG